MKAYQLAYLSMLSLCLATPAALASEGGSTATGSISLPSPEKRRAPPIRGQGFVRRAKNPLRPPDGLNPLLEMVVVLEGGPIDPVDKKPRSARYEIVGENFKSDILPVVVGGKVEIQNMGRNSPRLYSESNPDIVPADPINKKGVRTTKPIEKAHTPIDLKDRDSVHFGASIVAFEHAYFAVPGFDGSVSIEGVPAGTWKVRLWHRDGWVLGLPDTKVTLPLKRGTKGFRINLPPILKTTSSQ